jgi:hypothetical protein
MEISGSGIFIEAREERSVNLLAVGVGPVV